MIVGGRFAVLSVKILRILKIFIVKASRCWVSSFTSIGSDDPTVKMLKETKSGGWRKTSGSDAYHASDDATLFSSSLPVLPHEKLNLNGEEHGFQSVDDVSTGLHKLPQSSESEEIEVCALGSLLPDDENELLAGVVDDFDLSGLPNSLEDLEDYDLFGSGGGMELETEPRESVNLGISKLSISDVGGNGLNQYGFSNGGGNIYGEHPYGEHPSRTLFVRNINSNVEDSELRELFEEHGDIRTLYTACKHRGFVMISYYDIRAARTAMRLLQNKPVRRRKLDIHFSIPKDNPSEKDINQGTLVVFNLDASVSNEDLHQIFGAYGEIKEIRETPHKRHHKFIEYYDVRAAEAALKSLNRSDIAGKCIKLEPSRPGGTRRNLMLQMNQDIDQDDSRTFRHKMGSPVMNSPSGNWLQISSAAEHSRSPIFSSMSPPVNSHLPGLASVLHPQASSSIKIAGAGNNLDRLVEHAFTSSNSNHGIAFKQPHSFPEPKMGLNHGSSLNLRPSTSNGYGAETLSGPQFLWGSPGTHSERSSSSAWPATSVGPQFPSNGKAHAFPYSGQRGPFIGSSQFHHHVGSAPSGVAFERHFGFFPNSPDTSFTGRTAFGGWNIGSGDRGFMVNVGSLPIVNPGIQVRRNLAENGSSMRMMPSSNPNPVLFGNGNLSGLGPTTMESLIECGRRWVEHNGNQVENRNQFQIDLEKVVSGQDARTTVMMKNIPNKYTSNMLLAAIDEKHRGMYDFFYLPIDFKNKCNVGYAFINMLSPSFILSFYEAFNGKRWEMFNSEKVASLAYARIQGKAALVAHFENSSLMNEDKCCRPIVFHPGSPDGSEQLIPENLNSSLNIIHQLNDSLSRGSPLSPEDNDAGLEQRKGQ